MSNVRVPAVYVCAFIIAATVIDTALMVAVPPTGEPARNLIVAYHDLDLTRSSDIAILESRLTDAARSICRRPTYVSEPVLNHRACVTDAVARARPMMDQLIAEERMELVHVRQGDPRTAR